MPLAFISCDIFTITISRLLFFLYLRIKFRAAVQYYMHFFSKTENTETVKVALTVISADMALTVIRTLKIGVPTFTSQEEKKENCIHLSHTVG